MPPNAITKLSSFPIGLDLLEGMSGDGASRERLVSSKQDLLESEGDSNHSLDENELVERLPLELKECILFHKYKKIDKLIEQLTKYTHYAFAQDAILEVQLASSQWMYNRIQNDGEMVLIFDMRSMYDIFRG